MRHTLTHPARRIIRCVQAGRPVTYTGRITTVAPCGQRDQTDPFLREPVAVIDGIWAETTGHPTPGDAEQWARNLLERAGGNRSAFRLSVTANPGHAPVAVSGRGPRGCGWKAEAPR